MNKAILNTGIRERTDGADTSLHSMIHDGTFFLGGGGIFGELSTFAERAGKYFRKKPPKTQLHHRCIYVSWYPKYAFEQGMTLRAFQCQSGRNRILHKQKKIHQVICQCKGGSCLTVVVNMICR